MAPLTKPTNYEIIIKSFTLPKPKTNFLKRSFSYRGALSWNQILMEKLPIIEIPETSISSFKRVIDGLCF
jgi:hypothetical protein